MASRFWVGKIELKRKKSSSLWIVFISVQSTTFRNFISNILKGSAKKPMGRILARWIVAFMTNKKTFRNFTYLKLVTKSVRRVILSLGTKISVAISSLASNPIPAFVGFTFNKTSKVLVFGGFLRKKVKSSVSFHTGVMSWAHSEYDLVSSFTVMDGAGFHPSYIIRCILNNQHYYGF
jgi:hypothetical protein